MSVRWNLYCDQGTDFSYTLPANAVGIANLSGYSVNAIFKKAFESINTVSFGTSVSNNLITLSLTPEQTANVYYGMYVYSIFATSSANVVTCTTEGFIEISPTVSANGQ